ncbi:MAG: DUF1648 domain-containing protein [Clostridia bacterium]|nr:DUF1648 domain-containing protein [Clostridia bacterium]
MLKNHKKTLIITSVVTLLPMVAGIILWNRLPEMIATHFGIDNQPDGWSSKAFTVFGLPLIMFGLQIISAFATQADPKNKNIKPKMLGLILWIIPVISIVLMGVTYATALGKEVKMGTVTMILLGIVFIVLGNYMPKYEQNYTIGIKLPWTLNDTENWNRTHRLSGKIFVAGGVLMCATAFIGNLLIHMIITGCMILIPVVYSYMLYKKKQ